MIPASIQSDKDLISFYELVLREVNAIIVIHECDDAVKPVWFNDATERISGFKPEEVVFMGKNASTLTLHPDDQVILKDFVEVFSSTSKSFYHGVQRILRKSGEWFWIYVNLRVIERHKNKLPKKVIVVAIEIDEHLNSTNQFHELLKENLRLKNEIQVQKLSPRQKEILELIAKGNTDNEIASKLFLSIHTVKTHRKNILRILNLKNAAQLSNFAVKCGIV